ncbi:hypothetical protein GpartN1_g2848.t1 [Galdieria partita]|uniref:ribonuclease Z n=1 Tax=Galdieria partita TaxID=83374 RepID=A0A9C7PW64_9RHOD|nr:hypothetical protein GpartN1_g2354.t1 [Galdieria partita]GJQ11057.1 hypothetical protein GpartN1_g2848.t1 [Galdieria partita]
MVQCHLQVVGSGKADTGLSIILFFDDHRYLFNCGEGTQRLCAEKGLNLFRVDTVFFTQLDALSAGGLFGTLLTLADAGKTSLELFGPTGLARFFTASSSFYRRPSLELSINEIGFDALYGNIYQDMNIEVAAVPLVSTFFPKDQKVDGSKLKRPRITSKKLVVCYVVTMKDIPGKFDPLAAKALNVPKGPLFGRLSKGETITLSDGKKIFPSQVVSEPFPGPCIGIVSCPDIHYISSVTSSSRLSRFALRSIQNSKKKERHLCVVHMGTSAVFEDKNYIEWAQSLGEDVHHILLLEDSLDAPLIFDSQAELLKLLSTSVDKELFQVPKDTSTLDKTDRKVFFDLQKRIMERWSNVNVVFGESLLKYHLAPLSKLGVDRTAMGRAYQVVIDPNTERENEDLGLLETTRSQAFESSRKSPTCFEDVGEVIFFGTGAAIPSKLRNVSGICLHLYHRGGILLDCGEGTFGQILRVFGITEVNNFIAQLKLIFVSHMHADHHLGLLRILEYRLKLDYEQPLIILGPSELSVWLEAYEQINGQLLHYVFLDNESFTCPQEPIVNYMSSNIGLQVETVPVLHCFHAYGIVLFDNLFEWKMVYSGDTMPCDALIRAGQGANLVIHEATFESNMEQIALEKGHCTYRQALDVCKAMNPEWIILTHFSQRYAKFPVIDNLSDTNEFVAFDLLRVPFSKLSLLPSLLPALCELFKGEEESNGKELHDAS